MDGQMTPHRRGATRLLLGLAVTTLLLASCGSDDEPADPVASSVNTPTESSPWPHANHDVSGARTTTDSPIDASTVDGLEVAWTFEVPGEGVTGALATTPVIVDDVVWVSDLNSNVYGVDLRDGTEVLRIENNVANFGPNGVAVGSGRVFVAPDNQSVASYDAESGDELWRRELTEESGGSVNIQPLLIEDTLLVATSALAKPGSRGTLFALDATTGDTEWEFDTIESPDLWGHPEINSGGGSWYPPAVDVDARRVYWGTSNPYPWPGVPDFPNGSSRPGDNRWTDSTVALDLDSGELLWAQQHREHDLFDLDSSLAALADLDDGSEVVIGSGKLGRVIGMDPDTGDVLYDTAVGRHENDDLESFEGEIEVYPGYVGGITTPLAVADGVVYVAVVNAPSYLPLPSIDFEPESPNFAIHNGQMVAVDAADGTVLWDVEVEGQAFGGATVVNDLVFGSTLTGEFFALDRASGETVWSSQLDAGVNAWPAVADDLIVVPAGVDIGEGPPGLVAFRLSSSPSDTATTSGS